MIHLKFIALWVHEQFPIMEFSKIVALRLVLHKALNPVKKLEHHM